MSGQDLHSLKDKIKKYALEIGIDKIGFTGAQPLADHLPRLMKRAQAGFKNAIREGDPQKRVNPAGHLSEARSVISAAVAYPGTDDEPSGLPGGPRGRFSFVARGLDYHAAVKEKLHMIREFIEEQVPQARTVVMVDKEEILEKALAVRAGLGWFGRNTLLVTPEFGSFVCLGEIVTDIPFPPDDAMADMCGECRECILACPVQALDDERKLDLDRCLAGLTISKAMPGRELREHMGNTVYGCDLCQQACPHNRPAHRVCHPEFASPAEEKWPLLADLITMSNADFKRRFGHTSGAWRGRTPVQRNAVIAAGNLRSQALVPLLISILDHDDRPVMRGAAAWALGRIGGEGINALREAEAREEDLLVIAEIEQSLKNI